MSDREGCARSVLVESSIAKIEVCACGMIHLSAGPLTVRFDLQAFETLSATIIEARERLHRRAPQRKAIAPS